MRIPITREALAPLVKEYGDRWNIWPSAQGWYACATRRKDCCVSWIDLPHDAPERLSPTLVEDSVDELAKALAREADYEAGHDAGHEADQPRRR